MLAARWHARRDVRVEEIAEPGAPPPGWVRLRVDACGICGTDVEEYQLGPVLVPTAPHPLSHRSAPLTLGHEPSATVEAVGDGVALRPGTRVAVETNLHCGECWWCRRGDTQLCTQLASLGLMGDGALAELMLAPASMCAPLSDSVPAAHGALAEPLSVAVRAARRGGVLAGSTVGIVGGGTVGLLLLQVALRRGASQVVVVDRVESRRALASQLGAAAAVTPEEASQAALDLTGGVGLDVTVEAAGNSRAAMAAISLARRGGRSVLLGVYDDVVPLSMLDMLMGEREVVASLSHTFAEDFVEAVRMIDAGAVQLDPLITDRIPLRRVVEDGFTPLIDEPMRHLKIIVEP
ncbi:MAG TPA: alcohol dehydrogenase catalytic domain-containing protein [Candidatus Dormibacteraeota bacterium]|nr:alcohol dehydrogenase catalytic domain-containing protein [Candidatus Dormibacteraeota bacterium]